MNLKYAGNTQKFFENAKAYSFECGVFVLSKGCLAKTRLKSIDFRFRTFLCYREPLYSKSKKKDKYTNVLLKNVFDKG